MTTDTPTDDLRERFAMAIGSVLHAPRVRLLAAADAALAAMPPAPAPTVVGWQPIATAPKDGTPIIIGRHDWDCFPVAQWMEYPGNPVLDANNADVWMSGWGHDSIGFTAGAEDYWLGWEDDPMPTHWMPLIEPPRALAAEAKEPDQ